MTTFSRDQETNDFYCNKITLIIYDYNNDAFRFLLHLFYNRTDKIEHCDIMWCNQSLN